MNNQDVYDHALAHIAAALALAKRVIPESDVDLDFRPDLLGEIIEAEYALKMFDGNLYLQLLQYRNDLQSREINITPSDINKLRCFYLLVETAIPQNIVEIDPLLPLVSGKTLTSPEKSSENVEPLPITAITCTGDRPIQFSICLKIMTRMIPRPAQWLIVDDGNTPIDRNSIPEWAEYIRRERLPDDPSMTLSRNILTAMEHLKFDRVVFIEDDDWYPCTYLAELIKETKDYEACGAKTRHYFQLTRKSYRCFRNKFSITASLLLNNPAAINAFRHVCIERPHSKGLDIKFWRSFTGSKKLHSNKMAASVGMKSWGTGQRSGFSPSHRTSKRQTFDPELKKLYEWLPSNEVAWYLGVIGPKCVAKIGVIIPVYNSAQYLIDLLYSLEKQTLPPYQIIVIDDGSDNANETVAICEKFAIKCIARPHFGANAARNFGATQISEDVNFLYFADCDIILDKDAFEKMFNLLEQNPDAGYCYPNFYVGEVYKRYHRFKGSVLKVRNFITMCSLIRRKIWQPFDEELKCSQDYELWLRLYLEYNIFGVWLDYPAFRSKIRPGRISDVESAFEACYYIRTKFEKHYAADINRDKKIIKSFVIDDQSLDFLLNFIKKNKIKSVLEFGSGKSTQEILACDCDVITLETNTIWAETMRSELAKYKDRLTVIDYKYPDMPEFSAEFCFIDGPIGSLSNGRAASIKYAATKFNLVAIHDAQRPAESLNIKKFLSNEFELLEQTDSGMLKIFGRKISNSKNKL